MGAVGVPGCKARRACLRVILHDGKECSSVGRFGNAIWSSIEARSGLTFGTFSRSRMLSWTTEYSLVHGAVDSSGLTCGCNTFAYGHKCIDIWMCIASWTKRCLE